MPVAVITEPSERKDLKSLPEGFVVVKRMTYGQHLYRRSIGAKMLLMDEKKNQDRAVGEVKSMEDAVAVWEFANLIEDHNLTDEQGRQLNFADPNDVRRLHGKIGDEISQFIDELNNFRDIEEGNSPGASAPSTS